MKTVGLHDLNLQHSERSVINVFFIYLNKHTTIYILLYILDFSTTFYIATYYICNIYLVWPKIFWTQTQIFTDPRNAGGKHYCVLAAGSGISSKLRQGAKYIKLWVQNYNYVYAQRQKYAFIFVSFIKLCICMILFYKSQSI